MKAVNTLPPPTKSPAEFFKLNNTYVIPEGSKLNDLLDDALVLLDSGIDVFSSLGEELDDVRAGWAGIHALRQARAVFMQVYERAYERPNRQSEASSEKPSSTRAEVS